MGVILMANSNRWASDLLPIVFTRLKKGLSKEFKTNYGLTDKSFSTVSNSTSQPTFPFVYVKSIVPKEVMQTISNDVISGINFTIQIDVTTNTSQEDADNIAYELLQIMKQMKFNISSLPTFDNQNNEYRSTARYTRLIGASDTL